MEIDKPMMLASKLPERYGIGKSLFYQRRSYLKSLGYNLEPEKDGNRRKYSDEQIKLLDELDRYILQNGGMEGFPPANASAKTHPSQKPAQEIENKNGSTLVHLNGGNIETSSGQGSEINSEIYVETDPTADIKEHQLKSVDGAAQYSAAELLAVFNYRQLDYLKNRNFTIPGLAEEVQKSSDAVRQCFESMTGTPGESIKKSLEKLRQRDKQKAPSSLRS